MSRECMTSSTIWRLLFVIQHFANIAGAAVYFTGYLQESCRCSAVSHFRCDSFTLSPLDGATTSGFVSLSRDARRFSPPREFYCSYTIVAPPDMAVGVRINSLRLPMKGATCRASVLRIYDGNSTQFADRQLVGVCGSALPTQISFVSTSEFLTLSYHHSADVASQTKSFNVTFTYFALRHSGCLPGEFRCRSTGRCVSTSLVCDGVANCADSSDESTQFDVCGKRLRTCGGRFVLMFAGVPEIDAASGDCLSHIGGIAVCWALRQSFIFVENVNTRKYRVENVLRILTLKPMTMNDREQAANPFVGTTVGVAVCLVIMAFLLAVATGRAKRQRGSSVLTNAPPGECLRHHHSSSSCRAAAAVAAGMPGPQVDYSMSTGQLTRPEEVLRHQPAVVSHVTVDVIRATPPPPYESLFPNEAENFA